MKAYMSNINNKAVNVADLKVVYNDLVDKIKNIIRDRKRL